MTYHWELRQTLLGLVLPWKRTVLLPSGVSYCSLKLPSPAFSMSFSCQPTLHRAPLSQCILLTTIKSHVVSSRLDVFLYCFFSTSLLCH